MNLHRRSFLKSAGACFSAPAFLSARNRKPNVLFILTDEWRAQAASYNHDPNAHTPVLDRLARESINFENAISGHPVCCPARASMMTGQYSLTHGVFINDVELKPNAPTLAELFTKAGYRTGFIGKWHLYGSPDGKYGRRLAFIPPDKRLGFDYWKACECSHDYNHSLYFEGNDPSPKYWSGYDAFSQTDDACHFIERQSKSSDPFFLFLSLGPPHFPYETAPKSYQEMYANRSIQFRPNVPENRRKDAEKILRGYYAHIAALDECLNRLFSTLARNSISEDTIVVFTSDHGDMMLSQGLTTKLYPWDESIRVPLLIRYPRKQSRKIHRIQTPINTPDLMPTLLGLAELKADSESIQGTDYSALALGGSSRQREDSLDTAALLNLPVAITEARRYGIAEYRGLRTERYTYARSIHGPWLLYDNQADPFQKHNLCNDSNYTRIQMKLNCALDARLSQLKDDFSPGSEYVRRGGVDHYREVHVPVGHVKSPWGDWESTWHNEK